jgi:hypothetical protein
MAGRGFFQKKKKGPLAIASGPSLGRKRPRRAAIAQGATAPQQYATALHKAQVFLHGFPYKFRWSDSTATGFGYRDYLFVFNYLYSNYLAAAGRSRKFSIS